jgi:hypothetical protein
MSEHIVSVRVYITIFMVLLVGTALTVAAAFADFPWRLNTIVALTIATIKATFVVLYLGRPPTHWTWAMPGPVCACCAACWQDRSLILNSPVMPRCAVAPWGV